MKPQNIIAQITINLKNKKWNCLAAGCDEVAINSHLIQQNGLLRNISCDGHLVELKMVDAYKWNKNEQPLAFQKVGISQALSHKVFCSLHDTAIFKPIEDQNKDFRSMEAFLLFSYRSLCAEIRKKLSAVEQHNRLINANSLDGIIDKENLKTIVNGNELGVRDLEILKKELEDEIGAPTNLFSFYTFVYPQLEIYASAIFSATNISFDLKDNGDDLKNIYIHILPLTDETMILVGFNNSYTSPEILNYCESWKDLSMENLEYKLTELFATNIENWGLSLQKYASLKEKNKIKYIDILRENMSYFGIAKKENFNLFEK